MFGARLSLPDDAHVELTVALGTTQLSLRQVFELSVGQIVSLGRPLAGPFELRAAGRLVGKGSWWMLTASWPCASLASATRSNFAMPIYEYKCNACGKEFEYQQRMSDPEKTECEACGKSALERLIRGPPSSLKGGGWYKDLYSSSKPGDSSRSSTSSTPAASTAAVRARRRPLRRRVTRAAAAARAARARAVARAAAAVGARPVAGSSRLQGCGERFVIGQLIDGRRSRRPSAVKSQQRRPHLRGTNIAPCLAVVLVGEDPASAVYVKSKTKAAREANIDVRDHKLPATTSAKRS